MVEHFEPRPWQRPASRFLYENPRAMLVKDPGLGKTGTVYWTVQQLRLAGVNPFPALILGPKRVADVVWTGERDRWDVFQDLDVVKVMGTPAQRFEALRRAPVADIYVANYDLVVELVKRFEGRPWPFRSVVADESQRLKGLRMQKGAVRAAALRDIARHTDRWWNLTGTPTPNGLQDLWGQMYFVDFGARLKPSYTAYLEAFFIENRYSRKITTQMGADAAIHDLVKDRLRAFRAEDWLDLKKPQMIPVEFELSPSARAVYRDMEKDFFAQIFGDGGVVDIEAGSAGVKAMKLLEIASGGVYSENATHEVHDGRLEALSDIVEQTGDEPLLVTYWWKFDVPRILKRYPNALVYNGKKDEDRWNTGKVKMMLLHEQAAHGLNLHKPCRDIVFYSYTYSGELFQQMIERVGPVRQMQAGKTKVVRVWTIQAKHTLDSAVLESNEGKISIEQALKRARAVFKRSNV